MPTLIFAGDCDRITPLHFFVNMPAFHHENIVVRSIKNAGHYPWIDAIDDVAHVFEEYCKRL